MQECDTLKAAFRGLGSTSAYVLGDGLNGLQWHVFVAGKRWLTPHGWFRDAICVPLACAEVANGAAACGATRRLLIASHICRPAPPAGAEAAHPTAEQPLYTLEVCMTGLSPAKAAQFFRSEGYVSAQHTTRTSGIQALVPGAGEHAAWGGAAWCTGGGVPGSRRRPGRCGRGRYARACPAATAHGAAPNVTRSRYVYVSCSSSTPLRLLCPASPRYRRLRL